MVLGVFRRRGGRGVRTRVWRRVVGVPMSPLPMPEDSPPSEDLQEMAAYQIERARALALSSGGKNEALPALLMIAQAQTLLFVGEQIARIAHVAEQAVNDGEILNHGQVSTEFFFGGDLDEVIRGIANALNSIDSRLR